jgi:4-diphosphocytidyl-2-C-methyl-D-erythritol kinase
MSEVRSATLPALAKINLDLRVLGKRADGYHELRTVFQTVSLADAIGLSFERARQTSIVLDDPLAIPNNLVERAARAVLEAMRVSGRVEMRLRKRIPMGAGLGGGSSDAAAILLGLPALAGREIALPRLIEIAQGLGSDVPFFLFGGRAAAIGRGTELFPLPDLPAQYGVLAAPGVHVSTAGAYRALGARLTTALHPNKIGSFQSHMWGHGSAGAGVNDFEAVVFETHPQLKPIKSKLLKAGASSALMTGSGSALFGLFANRADAARAVKLLSGQLSKEMARLYRISLVSRVRYRSIWWRALHEHIDGRTWPPRSRYSR